MNQWSQGAFYYYCFKTFKTQNFTIKLSNHLLKVNQIKQLPVGTILSFYYFGNHLRFCSSVVWLWFRYTAVEASTHRNGEIRQENEERNKSWKIELQGDGRHTLWRVDRNPSTRPGRHQHPDRHHPWRADRHTLWRPSRVRENQSLLPETVFPGFSPTLSTCRDTRLEHVVKEAWLINRSIEEKEVVGEFRQALVIQKHFCNLHFSFYLIQTCHKRNLVTLQYQFNNHYFSIQLI